MRFTVLTLFPDMIRQGLSTSILGRAEERGFISFDIRNIRDTRVASGTRNLA